MPYSLPPVSGIDVEMLDPVALKGGETCDGTLHIGHPHASPRQYLPGKKVEIFFRRVYHGEPGHGGGAGFAVDRRDAGGIGGVCTAQPDRPVHLNIFGLLAWKRTPAARYCGALPSGASA